MRRGGLRARARRRFRNTTLSKHREPIAPNLVARQFEVTAPNHVWVTDLNAPGPGRYPACPARSEAMQ